MTGNSFIMQFNTDQFTRSTFFFLFFNDFFTYKFFFIRFNKNAQTCFYRCDFFT